MARLRALVYRGPAACSECPAALAELLGSSRWRFEVTFVGDAERQTISRATLAGAAVYAQPGGGRSLQRAHRRIKGSTEVIRAYVRSGGRYLGVCMGGYLAADWRGFGLLAAEADPYIGSAGADVTTRGDTLVDVRWRGLSSGGMAARPMFFQDGPLFLLPTEPTEGTTVLGRYAANDAVAAMVAPFGRGWVGVSGPHPEAPQDWYEAHGLPGNRCAGVRLGHDLVDVLMTSGTPGRPSRS